MTVLHIAAEMAPLAKVGGLADVVGALPEALAGLGVASAVLMPLYGGPEGEVAQKAGPLATSPDRSGQPGEVVYGGRALAYEVFRAERGEAPVFLLHQPEHFGEGGVYFGPGNLPFPHAEDRFPVFQLCALDWLASGASGLHPDVLHLHDHHTGLIPALIQHDARYEPLADAPTVFTVHSADHQGWAPEAIWEKMGAPLPAPEAVRVGDTLNTMKAALRYADAVTTVSPTYAQELQADDEMAHGLAEEFRRAAPKLTGIVNGVDTSEWDPATDPHLPATYASGDLSGKAETQRAVCDALGLDARGPLLTFVGRLTREKGAEILPGAVARIIRETDARVAVLGSGAPEVEAAMQAARLWRRRRRAGGSPLGHARLRQRARAPPLRRRRLLPHAVALRAVRPGPALRDGLRHAAHRPRRRRPARHRAPVGRRRGDRARGLGFPFDTFTEDAFVGAVREALAVYHDADAYARLQQNAMAADHSWNASARAYVDLYQGLAI